jgi:hypothetical protein
MWLNALKYMRTPPTHYFPKSSGQERPTWKLTLSCQLISITSLNMVGFLRLVGGIRGSKGMQLKGYHDLKNVFPKQPRSVEGTPYHGHFLSFFLSFFLYPAFWGIFYLISMDGWSFG